MKTMGAYIAKHPFSKEPMWKYGRYNGYVQIPGGHPFWGKDYLDVSIEHPGGLTFSEQIGKHWVFGFDHAHYMDYCRPTPKNIVEQEAKYLLKQITIAGKTINLLKRLKKYE